jgi:hypothetical protein
MTPDIINKLHTALYSVTPLVNERERIIGEMGEVIWLESLEKSLLALPEDKRGRVVSLLNEEKLDEAVSVMEEENVDLDTIITSVSTSVLQDVLALRKA